MKYLTILNEAGDRRDRAPLETLLVLLGNNVQALITEIAKLPNEVNSGPSEFGSSIVLVMPPNFDGKRLPGDRSKINYKNINDYHEVFLEDSDFNDTRQLEDFPLLSELGHRLQLQVPPRDDPHSAHPIWGILWSLGQSTEKLLVTRQSFAKYVQAQSILNCIIGYAAAYQTEQTDSKRLMLSWMGKKLDDHFGWTNKQPENDLETKARELLEEGLDADDDMHIYEKLSQLLQFDSAWHKHLKTYFEKKVTAAKLTGIQDDLARESEGLFQKTRHIIKKVKTALGLENPFEEFPAVSLTDAMTEVRTFLGQLQSTSSRQIGDVEYMHLETRRGMAALLRAFLLRQLRVLCEKWKDTLNNEADQPSLDVVMKWAFQDGKFGDILHVLAAALDTDIFVMGKSSHSYFKSPKVGDSVPVAVLTKNDDGRIEGLRLSGTSFGDFLTRGKLRGLRWKLPKAESLPKWLESHLINARAPSKNQRGWGK